MHFYAETFVILERGFEPTILSNFPSMIWIFMESEEPKIKSKQASKKHRTLIKNAKGTGAMPWFGKYAN
jgi:hypothetical protein